MESLKALVSHVMTERVDRRGRNLVLAVFDVSRAHFFTVCVNAMFTWSHPQNRIVQDPWPNWMQGTQDASNAWQKLWGAHFRSNGLELGASNPALYRSELMNGFCHGDEFVTAAAEDQIKRFGNCCTRSSTRDGSA